MSRILITIGLDSKKSDAQPQLVYLGRSGADQRTAEQSAPQPRLLRINHALGIPKNNPLAAANAAALDAAGEQEGAVVEVTQEEMQKFTAEMKRLQDLVAAQSLEIEKLKSASSTALEEATAEIIRLQALVPPPAAPSEIPPAPEESIATPSETSAAPAPDSPPKGGSTSRRRS